MLDPDQNVADVLREAGLKDFAAEIAGNPIFQCNTAMLGSQRCLELANTHRRQ